MDSQCMAMNFENFSHWIVDHLKNRKATKTLGGKAKFFAIIDVEGDHVLFEFGSRGEAGRLSCDKLKMVWNRYMSLGNRNNLAGEYTDPNWPETPNRILSPYAAALIRDFVNDFQNRSQQ